MPLFEVAVITKPSESDVKFGHQAEIVLNPTAVIASDATAAAALAGALVGAPMIGAPDAEGKKLGQTEVLVRPFK